MSSIDERIVQMEFDNSLFDKNVESSIKALEKLNVALKMDGIDKNLSNISSSVNKMDFSKVESGIDALQKRFSTLGIMTMTWTQDFARAIEGVVGNAIRSITSLPAKAIAQIRSGGWSRATNIDQARFKIEGLFKEDAEAWSKISDDINYAVTDTAYGFDEAASAAAQLSASGIQMGDDMKHALLAISGVAAMTSSSYSEIAPIFTKVAGVGRLYATELNSLSFKGINAASTLADYLKKTGKDANATEASVHKMIQKGDIDFKTFSDAMFDAFGLHAKEANQTFEGSLANMKAALSRFGQPMYQAYRKNMIPVFNAMKTAISTFKGFFDDASETNEKGMGTFTALARVMESISRLATGGIKFVTENLGFAANLAGGLTNIFNWLADAVDRVSAAFNIFAPKTEESAEKTEEAVEKVETSLEEIDKLVDRIWTGEFGEGEARFKAIDALLGVEGAGKAVQNRFNELAGYDFRYADAADLAALATTKEAESIEKAEDKIDSFSETKSKFVNTLMTVRDAITKAFGKEQRLAAIQWFLNGVQALQSAFSILGQIIGAFLEGAIKGILNIFGKVAEIFGTVTNAIFNAITAFGTWFNQVDAFGKLKKVFEDIFKALSDAFGFLSDWVKVGFQSVGTVFGKIGDVVSDAGGKISVFFSSLRDTKGFRKLNGVFTNIKTTFKGISDKAIAGVTKFFGDLSSFKIKLPELDIQGMAEKAGEALGWLGTKIIQAKVSIKDFFKSVQTDAKNPLHGIYTYFSNLSAKGLIDSVSSKLKRAGSSIKRFFIETGIAAKAQETFNTVISNIKETAPQMFQGLLDIFGKIGASILGAKDKIVEFWGSFKQTQGFQTLKSGIVNVFNNILNAIGKASTGIANFFKSIFGSFKDFKMPEFDMGKLAGTVSEKIEWLKGKFCELKDKVSEIFSGAQGIGGTALETITSFFTNIDLSNGIETISSNLEKAKNAISDFFKMLGGLFGAKEASASPIDNVTESTASLADGLEGEESILNHFLEIVGKVKDGTNKVWDFIYPILSGMAVLKIGFGIGGFFKQLGGVFGGFRSLQDGITRVLKASAKAQKSKAILNVAIAIGILAASFFALGQLSWDQFKVAAAGIGVVTVALIALMGAFRLFFGNGGGSLSIGLNPVQQFEKIMAEFGTKMSKALSKFGTAAVIIAFVVGIKMLIGAIKEIGEMDGDTLKKGIVVVVILGLFISACYKIIASGGGFRITRGIGTAIVMIGFVAAIKLLVGAVKELGEMDTGTLKKGIVAVVILGVLIGALIKVSKNLKKVKAGPILALAITIGVVAFALYKLTELDTTKLLGAATSLGIVIAAMAALSYALSKMETKNIAASVVSMIGVGALLAEVAYILNMFTSNPDLDADKMLTVSESISLLMGVMGGLTYLSQALGKTGFSGLKASAWGAADIGVVTGIVTAILALVGLGAGAAYDFLGPEMAQTVIDGLDWLGKIFEKVSETLGKMIGGFFGGLLGGALGSFTSELPGIATNLNTFITNLGSLAGDDAPSLSGITTMIDTLRTIASAARENVVADIMNNWFNEGEGGSAMGNLGDKLIEFAGKMKQYANEIKGLNVMTILSTSFAIDSVMQFANAVPPQGGWADTILGDSSLATFATNLIPFAIAMRAYSSIISSFGGINESAVESSARCGTMLAELNNAIPRNGGLYGLLAGNKDLSTFGDQLKGFGSGLVEFSKAIAADDVTLDEDATKKATAVAGILAEFAKTEIQATGGVLQWLMGTKDIGVFGGQAAEFGTGIVAFANSIKDAPLDTDLTDKAAQCGGLLANLATKLPPEGGALQWLMGEQNLASFGKQLPIFAQGLNSFSLRIAGFKSENVTGVTDSINALMEMLGILHQYGYTSTQTISTDEMFTAISSISNTLNDFATQMSTLETDKALTDIKEAGKKLADDFKAALLAGLEEGSKGPDATFVGPMQQTNYLKNILDSMFGTDAQIETEMAPYGERIAGPLIRAISNGMKSDSINLGDASSTLNMILTAMIGSDDAIDSEVKTVGSKIGGALVRAIGAGTQTVEGEGRGPGNAVSGLKKIIESIFGSGDSVPPEVEEKGKDLAKALYSAFQNGINNPEEAIEVVELLKMVVDSLEDGEPDIERAGASAASAYASGVSGNSWAARTAGSSLRTSAVNGASGGYSAMYEAGANVGRGYVAGINSQIDAVRTATARLAAAGQVSTAKQDNSHSPSRKYMKLGSYVAMGYAKGIVDNIPMVTDAVESMSVLSVGTATDSLDSGIEEMAKSASKSIAAAYAYINNVASQSLNSSPVITPVLDMSMLQNGMNYANGLWGLNGYNPFGYANSMFPSSAYQYTNGMMANDAYVTQTELRGIRTDLKNLGEAITHMNMVLDSGTLVGQLTPGIDSQLGAISGLKERWA